MLTFSLFIQMACKNAVYGSGTRSRTLVKATSEFLLHIKGN